MSLLKKLFGSKSKKKAAPPKSGSADVKAHKPGTIQAFDKYGREITITRDDWLNSVLLGNIEKAWQDPEELANLIVSALQDEFFHEVEDAAAHLCQIDPIPERAAVYYAIVFLQTERPAKAEALLIEHMRTHGESGTVLTNLAKAQSALGHGEESLQTLWHGLELDPNQDNGLGWYEVLHKEQGGDAARKEALERVAAIPGSWRAQLWLARGALEKGELAAALDYYSSALATAGDPAPTDLLKQMSGDLGNAGHLIEILNLVAPRFDLKHHGIQVGNNLIKANLDLGRIDAAKQLVQAMQLEQRPDWKDTLGYWEAELAKLQCATSEPIDTNNLKVSLLNLQSPLIFKPDCPTNTLFPTKADDAPRIAILGGSMDLGKNDSDGRAQPSDNPGRFCRALPLFLQEHLSVQTNAIACNLVGWITNGSGGFLVTGKPWEADQIAQHARSSEPPAEFAISTHLIARGENWTIQLRLIRSIDAHCLASHEYPIAEWQPHTAIPQILDDLLPRLAEEAGVIPQVSEQIAALEGQQLDTYLFRLEQSLAVRCNTIDADNPGNLSNPSEIIDGMLRLAADNPTKIAPRLLLLRTLASLKKIDPNLTASFQEKVDALMREHALSETATDAIQQELKEVFSV